MLNAKQNSLMAISFANKTNLLDVNRSIFLIGERDGRYMLKEELA